MGEGRRTRPRRFRQRLTAVFIAVAAVSAGVLAVLTYTVTSEYRWRNFGRSSDGQVRTALAMAPAQLDEQSFARLQAAYETRAGIDTVALVDGRAYSSAVQLSADDVPAEVRDGPADDLVTTDVRRDGHDYRVVAGDGPDGARYVFFFDKDQPQDSLRELRLVLLGGWVVVVGLAAAVGQLVARRTLRPVRQAAEAATALADGMLETRLPSVGEDEFRAWADAFNDMADALQSTIDELGEAAERQRRFTEDVAHDLRTPLTGMAVTAQLLAEQADDLPAPARRAATVLVRDVERLRELVVDLLELSRLDARADPVRAEPLDVRAALATTLAAVPLPDGVDLALAVDDGLEVAAERGRLRRVVGNVVANAAVHGGRAIRVTGRRVDDEVAIAVHDDGPGIDPEQAEKLFDRFAKGDLARSGGGSGLGLAIAREHARAMGGDIDVDPGPGRGATFTIRLPLAPSDDAAATDRAATAQSAG